MVKYLLFFLVAIGLLLYAVTFRNNKKKIKANILGKEREIRLGLLLLSVFIDGTILGFLLFYLIFYA